MTVNAQQRPAWEWTEGVSLPDDLTTRERDVLAVLDEQPHPIRATDLARMVGTSLNGTLVALRRLRRRGLAASAPDPDSRQRDNRRVWTRTTPDQEGA